MLVDVHTPARLKVLVLQRGYGLTHEARSAAYAVLEAEPALGVAAQDLVLNWVRARGFGFS